MNPYGRPPGPTPPPNNPVAASPPGQPQQPSGTPGAAAAGTGNGLRPSYGLMAERERDGERDRQNPGKPYSYPSPSTMLPRPSENASNPAAAPHAHAHPHQRHHHHHHHHHPSGSSSAGSTPRDERTNPYAPAPGSNPARKQEMAGVGMGAGLGRLSGGYGLFGGSFREQEMRERERQERIQRERERDLKPPMTTSPNQRVSIPANPTNPYPRPSLPPSPTTSTTSRNLPMPSADAKPSISPQLPPATATASNLRPNLPLPNLSSLGSRSLLFPFDRETRDTSSAMPSPAVPSGDTPAVSHNRSLSGSSRREVMGMPQAERSPPKAPSVPNTARSLYASGPPPLGTAPPVNRERDPQRSPVNRAATAASPREAPRDAVSPPAAPAAKVPTPGAAPPRPTSTRAPYSSSYAYPSNPSYAGSFGGFGLTGFGGYGAFGGPRWDHEREREARDVREAREARDARDAREARDREREREDDKRRKETAERVRDKEREDREREKWKDQRERERANSFHGPDYPRQSVPSAPGPNANQASQRQDIYRRPSVAFDKPGGGGYSRHIEVLNQPDPAVQTPITVASTAAPVYDRDTSVIQQVAPTREPRPYGYKPEAVREAPAASRERENISSSLSALAREVPVGEPQREFGYAPREKRIRMDAVVEEAQVAHQAQQAQRRSSQAKTKRRKMEEERVHSHHAHRVQSPAEKRDWAALAQPVVKRIEVSSAPVEAWLKTLPSLSRIITTIPYTGKPFTLAKTGLTRAENEGGIVVVRIGGGFLGRGWKVRGEPGWEDSTPRPAGPVCGAEDPERQCWGTDVYTDDSDLGLILVHAGWLRWLPPSAVYGPKEKKKDEQQFVNVTVRIVPRLVRYTATERNGFKTRGWGNGHDGASIVVERVERVKIDKKYLASRKRKARIAEWAHERALVAPVGPELPALDVSLEDDIRLAIATPATETIILSTDIHKGVVNFSAGFKWTPEAVKGWLDVPTEGDHAKSLWTHKLVLDGKDEAYHLSLTPDSTYSCPIINLIIPSSPAHETREILGRCDPSTVFFLPDGIASRTAGQRGVLFPVRRYRWEKLADAELGDWTVEQVKYQNEPEPMWDFNRSDEAEALEGLEGLNGMNGEVVKDEAAMEVDI